MKNQATKNKSSWKGQKQVPIKVLWSQSILKKKELLLQEMSKEERYQAKTDDESIKK